MSGAAPGAACRVRAEIDTPKRSDVPRADPILAPCAGIEGGAGRPRRGTRASDRRFGMALPGCAGRWGAAGEPQRICDDRPRLRFGCAVVRRGQGCFFHAPSLAQRALPANGRAPTPDRRGQGCPGAGERGACPGLAGRPYPADLLRRLCFGRKLSPIRFASLRIRSSQWAPVRFLFSAKKGSSAPPPVLRAGRRGRRHHHPFPCHPHPASSCLQR